MKKIKQKLVGMNPDFTYRGEAQTRIETLSDAVFAIAIALLVLSSSVPVTFDDLLLSLEDLIPFAICITLLMLVWQQHYLFFIRYGLQDVKTVVLNTILLFLILFYVYPLKFLFQVLYKLFYVLASGNKEAYNNLFNVVLKPEQGPQLMVIYGIGAAAIFFVLSLMYRYAYKRREDLKLSDKEVFDTKSSMQMNVIMGIVPVISMLIAGFRLGGPISFPLAGFAYWLYPIILLIYSRKRGRKRSQTFDIEKAHDDASEA